MHGRPSIVLVPVYSLKRFPAAIRRGAKPVPPLRQAPLHLHALAEPLHIVPRIPLLAVVPRRRRLERQQVKRVRLAFAQEGVGAGHPPQLPPLHLPTAMNAGILCYSISGILMTTLEALAPFRHLP